MNKIQDGWVLVEKSDFSCFDEVKSTSNGWAIISFKDLSASDVNTNKKMRNKKKGQNESACNQTNGLIGPMWFDISLND